MDGLEAFIATIDRGNNTLILSPVKGTSHRVPFQVSINNDPFLSVNPNSQLFRDIRILAEDLDFEGIAPALPRDSKFLYENAGHHDPNNYLVPIPNPAFEFPVSPNDIGVNTFSPVPTPNTGVVRNPVLMTMSIVRTVSVPVFGTEQYIDENFTFILNGGRSADLTSRSNRRMLQTVANTSNDLPIKISGPNDFVNSVQDELVNHYGVPRSRFRQDLPTGREAEDFGIKLGDVKTRRIQTGTREVEQTTPVQVPIFN